MNCECFFTISLTRRSSRYSVWSSFKCRITLVPRPMGSAIWRKDVSVQVKDVTGTITKKNNNQYYQFATKPLDYLQVSTLTVKEPPADDSQAYCSSSLCLVITVTFSATR